MKKLPPKEKIYEAFSAIADERVRIEDTFALVKSSDYKKEYQVKWKDENYLSNDNATYWQGYAGYPVIAVLMMRGILPLKKEIIENFKGINWHEINKIYKRDYKKAAEAIFKEKQIEDKEKEKIQREVEHIACLLEELEISVGKNSEKVLKK